MPGDTTSAGHENPYRASQPLDPRVDGGKPRQEPVTSRTAGSSGLSTAGTSGTGAATTGASDAFHQDSTRSHQPTEPAYSTSTATADPVNRSAGYTDSNTTRDPDYATHGTSSTSHQTSGAVPLSSTTTANPVNRSEGYRSPFDSENTESRATHPTTTGTSATGTQPHAEDQGLFSKVLGAVGLGGAGATAASALGYGSSSNEPHDTSAIATHPGQISLETGPPKHYRRESIPTTAYPAGISSPRAVAPPVGGSQGFGGSQGLESSTGGRDTTLSGLHTSGSHDVGRNTGIGGTQLPTTHTTARDTDAGVPHTTVHDLITTGGPRGDSHTGRDVALGGAAATATGVGAYGLHEHSHDHPSAATGSTQLPDPESRLAQPSTTTGTGIGHHDNRDTYGSTPASKPSITERIKEALPGVQSEREKNELEGTRTGVAGVSDRSHDPTSRTTGITGTSALPERSHAHQSGTTGTTALPDRTRDSPLDAVSAAPNRYDGQDARAPLTSTSPMTSNTQQPIRDDNHTGRNAALGAGTAAGVGGLAYAAHERDEDRERLAKQHQKDLEHQAARDQKSHQHEIEKAEKERQRELEKAEKHRQHEAEKAEKEHQRELEKAEKHRQHEAEKAEKQHHKELEKEEKHRQHELEKEEKERLAAAAAHEKREKARLASEEEDRRRREREATAATAGTAALGAGAGTAAIAGHRDEGIGRASHDNTRGRASHDSTYGRDHHGLDPNTSTYVRSEVDGTPIQKHTDPATHTDHHAKEKKPSIFKRIFKSRKNKDTGEDEQYSSDDEEDKARHYAAAGTAGTAGTAAGSHVPTHHSDTKGRTVLGSDPGRHSTEQHVDTTTGLPYDASRDPQAARRLSRETGADTSYGRGTDSAPYGTGAAAGAGGYTISNTGNRTADDRYHSSQPTSGVLGHDTTSTGHTGTTTGLHGEKPIDHHTGLPYDPSKDPGAAARLSESAGHHGPVGSDGLPQSAHEPFGVIGDHHR